MSFRMLENIHVYLLSNEKMGLPIIFIHVSRFSMCGMAFTSVWSPEPLAHSQTQLSHQKSNFQNRQMPKLRRIVQHALQLFEIAPFEKQRIHIGKLYRIT